MIRRALDGASDAEVGELGHTVAVDDDVPRLDVAMDDPARMRRVERVGDL